MILIAQGPRPVPMLPGLSGNGFGIALFPPSAHTIIYVAVLQDVTTKKRGLS